MTNRLAAWAIRSDQAIDRLASGIRAVHSGLWLGVLGDDDLADATDQFYSARRWWLEETIRSGLTEWERSVASRWFPDTGRVLVPACGSGREVLALAGMGYDVVGFDPNVRLIEAGRRSLGDLGASATLLTAPPDRLPDESLGSFDAVLVGWTGISHMAGVSARGRFLSDLRHVLAPGGPLVLSFLTRSEQSRSHAITYAIARRIRRTLRRSATLELGDTFHGSFDHHFTFPEMANELMRAGFTPREQGRAGSDFMVATAD